MNRVPQNAFEALGIGSMGAVEVLEDAAIALDNQSQSRSPTQYVEGGYKSSDDCHLGCSNQTPGGITIAAGATVKVTGVPTSPFKPKSVVIPSYQQIDLFVAQVTIGPFNAVEGDPVPAAGHSEVSLNQFVSWPTIQANSPIAFSIINAGAVAKEHFGIDIRGIRLRQ